MKALRVVALAIALATSASIAGAFTIAPTVITGGHQGDVDLIATQPVAPADQGKAACAVTVVTTNNESIHPNSDLIIASGGTSFVAANVERDTVSHTYQGTLTLGTTITVSVRLGADGIYSGGADVVDVVCPAVGPPTSSPPVTTPPVTPKPPTPVPARPPLTG